jgi:diguanylate cyclase
MQIKKLEFLNTAVLEPEVLELPPDESIKSLLEYELKQGILQNDFALYYQPIVSLKNKKLLSVEALARWKHPSRGLLLPNEFIPLAEQTGLILELSDQILRLACDQYLSWQAFGLKPFRISVNASAALFSQRSYIKDISAILEQSGMEPSKLELEVTESVAIKDWELTAQNLSELKSIGVSISIDDLGTGHSSLNYLNHFQVDTLKIDKSFIANFHLNERYEFIFKNIISLAHDLNLKVVAEGVESQKQLDFINGLGCDAAQGYFIHRPMPAEDFPGWLKIFKSKKGAMPG